MRCPRRFLLDTLVPTYKNSSALDTIAAFTLERCRFSQRTRVAFRLEFKRMLAWRNNVDRPVGAFSRVPGFKFQYTCVALICGALLFAIGCGGGAGAGAGASDPVVRMQQTTVSATNNPLVAQYSVTTTSGAASVSVQFGPTTFTPSRLPQI